MSKSEDPLTHAYKIIAVNLAKSIDKEVTEKIMQDQQEKSNLEKSFEESEFFIKAFIVALGFVSLMMLLGLAASFYLFPS